MKRPPLYSLLSLERLFFPAEEPPIQRTPNPDINTLLVHPSTLHPSRSPHFILPPPEAHVVHSSASLPTTFFFQILLLLSLQQSFSIKYASSLSCSAPPPPSPPPPLHLFSFEHEGPVPNPPRFSFLHPFSIVWASSSSLFVHLRIAIFLPLPFLLSRCVITHLFPFLGQTKPGAGRFLSFVGG